jgi:hypothetical protein
VAVVGPATSVPSWRPRPGRRGWSSSLVAVAAALVVDRLLAAGSGGDLDAPARSRPPRAGARTARRHPLGGDRGGGGDAGARQKLGRLAEGGGNVDAERALVADLGLAGLGGRGRGVRTAPA